MEKLIEILLNYVDPDEPITADSNLRNDCGLSSFDSVCVMDEVNTVFDIKMGFADFKTCSTVNDLWNCIEEKVQKMAEKQVL